MVLRIGTTLLLVMAAACGAARPQVAGITMPSPHGCFVQVWEQANFMGAADYVNGPRQYPDLREMPEGRRWHNRIRSAKVGPGATASAWSERNFRGTTIRLLPDRSYPNLPNTIAAQIESMSVQCAATSTQ